MEATYQYYPFRSCSKYNKWFDSHHDDMHYRYNERGQQVYTLQEIVELWETNLIIHNQ